MTTKIIALILGLLSERFFFGTHHAATGFTGNVFVPKSIYSGAPGPLPLFTRRAIGATVSFSKRQKV